MALFLTSLKKSSPFISRISGIQRFKIRPFFNQTQAHSSSSSSSSSSPPSSPASSTVTAAAAAAAAARNEQERNTDYDFGLFIKSASGIVIGAGLGFWIWSSSSSPQSSISFADWPKRKHLTPVDNGDGNQHSSLQDGEHETKPKKYILGDSFRRKVFFNYEKRIRMRSPPEKVFEYFASHRSPEGEVFMTPADLMRAIVPVFPPSESNLVREGNLRGERSPGHLRCSPSSFFMLFDTNGDGLISFAEYIFFVTLLSIPESSFSVAFKMFDLDNNGEIDREEFKKVMALMRAHNRQGARHRDGRRAGLKKIGHSVENGGLLEFFFGKDGKSCLQHTTFVEFLKNLHEEMLRLEFAHYDYKQRGTISAKDFALSMVASADMSHISKFLRRVDEINTEPHLKEMRFTLEEFMTFAELRKQLEPLSLAIFSYGKVNGLLTKKDFQRAASHVCGINLTDNVVDLIYHVFDVNRDGSLSANEFINVLHRREKEISHPNAEGASGLILCWLSCAKNCSFKDTIF